LSNFNDSPVNLKSFWRQLEHTETELVAKLDDELKREATARGSAEPKITISSETLYFDIFRAARIFKHLGADFAGTRKLIISACPIMTDQTKAELFFRWAWFWHRWGNMDYTLMRMYEFESGERRKARTK
jgi:hypothetical protein